MASPRSGGTRAGRVLVMAWALTGLAVALGAFFVDGSPRGALIVASACFFCFAVLSAAMVLQPSAEPPPLVPAHVAFMGRVTSPGPPQLSELSDGSHFEEGPSQSPEIQEIDEAIRVITRQINKVGIRLATGKISDEGYKHVVDGLKAKRAHLESRRVEFEMKA